MSANKEDTLRQFCDVTGADETRSRFFLESSNWQLDVALSSFYEHGGSVDEAPIPTVARASVPTLSDSDMESPPGSPLRLKKEKKKQPATGNFATLDSLQQESSSDEEEASKSGQTKFKQLKYYCDEDTCPKKNPNIPSTSKVSACANQNKKDTNDFTPEEEIKQLKDQICKYLCENKDLREEIERLKGMVDKGQAFYAGGSERSGQQIIGPGKNRKDIVTEMFKSVRERGAVVFEDEPTTAGRGRGGAFSGTGYRLGQTTDDHEPVQQAGPPAAQGEAVRAVRLRLYREGFTVDAGPVRAYSEPEHAEFLNCIRRGEIPTELAGAGEVRVSLEDRRHDAAPRAADTRAFAGKGHMLGSPTPAVVGAPEPAAAAAAASPAAAAAAAPAAAADRAADTLAAQAAVTINDAQPTTTIQFRLADGSRVAGRFNVAHTVQDLRAFVQRAAPGPRPFALLTSFPALELADPGATIDQANLRNSTLLQRLK